MTRTLVALLAIAPAGTSLIAPAHAQAQDNPTETRSGGHFANLFQFTFKPGKSDEALEILNETRVPAYRDAGIDVTVIEDLLGTKDIFLLVPLRDGPAYFASEQPAQDMDAWRSLNAMFEGDAAAAERRLDAFVDLLDRQFQRLVFVND